MSTDQIGPTKDTVPLRRLALAVVVLAAIVMACTACSSSGAGTGSANQTIDPGVTTPGPIPGGGFTADETAFLDDLHQGITYIGELDDASLVTLGHRGCQGLIDDHDLMVVQNDLYAIMRNRDYGSNDVGRVMDEAVQHLCPQFSFLLDGQSTDPSPQTPASTDPRPSDNGPDYVDQADLVADIRQQVEAETGRQNPNVSCQGELVADRGATLECSATFDGDGTFYPITVEFDSLTGGVANYYVTVADPLPPGE